MAGGYARISTLPDAKPSLQFLQDVGLLFRTVNFNFREQVDRSLRDGGVELGFGQISALGILRERPGINGAQLARHGMVSPQAMNAVLRELARKRFVERRDHPGSLRADAWHLSAKGEQMLERSRGIFGSVMSRMLLRLSSREQRQFERYLRLCAASLEAAPAARSRLSAPSPGTRSRARS
jgi:DNA-binding MarR family transcriptional regulator